MFFFHWVPNGTTAFDSDDQVVDESIFAFRVAHAEGGFATLDITIRNPRIGPLSPDREHWAWLGWKMPNDTIIPLFHGRLLGVPTDMNSEQVGFTFHARPEDFIAQKMALAQTLKVAPYWDPIWFDEKGLADPESVLAARTARWHIDRITNGVTVSDILDGEDGIVEFAEGDLFSVSINPADSVLRKIKVTASVEWKQYGRGEIDLREKLLGVFAAAGSDNGTVTSYTWQGLEKDWPQEGTDIGGGWTWGSLSLKLLSGEAVEPDFITIPITPVPTDEAPIPQPYEVFIFRGVFAAPEFTVLYRGERDRKETISFTLEADVQNIAADEEDDRTDELTFSSSNILLPLDSGGKKPLGNARRNSYFNLDRGKRSLDWLLSAARAKLCQSARAVEVGAVIRFEDAVDLSCRKSATFFSRNLPGGQATGKIIGYEFHMDDNKQVGGSLTIGCSVGHGGVADPGDPGEPSYVETGYMDDYQEFEGASYNPTGDITYPDYRKVIVDDGLPFEHLNADNCINGLRAEATLSFSGLPADGNTVVIGTRTYTWQDNLDDLVANSVLIGSDVSESIRNIAEAINDEDSFEGFLYGDDTEPHAVVVASTIENAEGTAHTALLVRARIGGTAQNATALSKTGTAVSWSSATLLGGTPMGTSFRVLNGEADQRDALEALKAPGAPVVVDLEPIFAAINDKDLRNYTRVQLDLLPIEAKGVFTTDFTVLPSLLKVAKTIDLEASSPAFVLSAIVNVSVLNPPTVVNL